MFWRASQTAASSSPTDVMLSESIAMSDEPFPTTIAATTTSSAAPGPLRILDADYHGRQGIVIEKRFRRLMFRNPGCLRMSKEAAIGGGRSDARNSRIFNIFALINIGERSGTGLSDIYSIWKEYGYEEPTITETYQPDQTTVTVQVELEEDATTTQENAGTTQENAVKDAVTTEEVAPKDTEVAPKIAPKDVGVAPKIAPKVDDVAPKDDESQKSAVKNIVADESVAKKCMTVCVHSLDGEPITKSRRMLLTHLTDVQGEGERFADESMTVLLKWGTRPLAQNGSAEISLALDSPANCEVWELAANGARLRKIESNVSDGCLRFAATVSGPDGARMLYEISAK